MAPCGSLAELVCCSRNRTFCTCFSAGYAYGPKGQGNEVLNQIRALAANSEDRLTKARELARIIRDHGQYRWVGVYDVGPEEVAIFGWSGPDAPAHPTFPSTRGLTASAISQGAPVVVADVRNDPDISRHSVAHSPKSLFRCWTTIGWLSVRLMWRANERMHFPTGTASCWSSVLRRHDRFG
jgi:hypothetical protein